jgi:ATP-dependent DNA helicase PIF1
MNQLTTEQENFHSVDGGAIQDMAQREKMLANFMAPQRLTLRLGAQVMLIKNVDDMLVNGSMGKILRFIDPAVYGTQDDPEFAGASAGGAVVGRASSPTAMGGAAKKGGRAPSPTALGGAAKKSAAAVAGKRYPVVQFDLPNGFKKRMLVMPETWTVELPSGEIQVSRTQVCFPL